MNTGKNATTFDEMLAAFMEAYPWKIAPLEVKRQLGRALNQDTWENIIEGVKNYAAHSDHVARGYVQHPARWLKEGNWMVDYKPPTPLHLKRYDEWTDDEKRSTAELFLKMRGVGVHDPAYNMRLGPGIEQRLKAEGYLEEQDAMRRQALKRVRLVK